MVKVVRNLGLASFVAAAIAVAGAGTAPAQEKTKSKTAPPAAAHAGTVEVHEGKDGFRFRIKDADGKVVAMATKGYPTKDDCVKALDFVKATLSSAKVVEAKDKK